MELLASTGQGNILSGNIYQDISCLVIKIPESKQLGIIIDDTNFYSNRINYQ